MDWRGFLDRSFYRQNGMIVGGVEAESPAAEAGLAAGDVVVAVGETEVQRPLDFQRAMLERVPGDAIQLTVRRSGKPLTLSLTLGKAAETRPWRINPPGSFSASN